MSTSADSTVKAIMKRYGLSGQPCLMPDPTVPLTCSPVGPSMKTDASVYSVCMSLRLRGDNPKCSKILVLSSLRYGRLNRRLRVKGGKRVDWEAVS